MEETGRLKLREVPLEEIGDVSPCVACKYFSYHGCEFSHPCARVVIFLRRRRNGVRPDALERGVLERSDASLDWLIRIGKIANDC